MSRITPESAARDLLESAWKGELGYCRLPVDPFQIARRLGLTVEPTALHSDVSGMLAKRPGQDPEIYVNVSDSEVRQRFSCAHELGHYIKRATSSGDEDAWGYVDRRGPSAARGTNADEIFANQFAAELLMPREKIAELSQRGLGVPAMAVQFNVSLEAMQFRVDNLGSTWT